MTPSCPRCGYDQSGEVARWEIECPLTSRCVECGLDFEWADLFDPYRQRLRGFVEHARGFRQTARWLAITLLWAAPCIWFWSKVKMHHRTNLRRAIGAMILAVAILRGGSFLIGLAHTFLIALAASGTPAWEFNPLLAVDALTYPLHGSRILESVLAGSPVPAWAFAVEWITFVAATIVQLAVWPLLWLALADTRRFGALRWSHIHRATIFSLSWLLGLELCRALAWLASFVARAGMILAGEDAIGRSAFDATTLAARPFMFAHDSIAFATPIWITVWWLCAITKGWKIRRGWLVWLLLTLTSGLAAFTVAVWSEEYLLSCAPLRAPLIPPHSCLSLASFETFALGTDLR